MSPQRHWTLAHRLAGSAQRVWAFARELSGEAALARRMGACGCAQPPREAVKQAWCEAFDQPHRCC